IRAATRFAATRAAATGVVAPQVAALTQGVLTTMLLTKLKSALAVLLVLGIATLSAGMLISRSRATEPAAGQERQQAQRDDLHIRVLELKQQLQQMQTKLATLERETLPPSDERNPRDAFPGNRFKYRIAFETGVSETREGGRLEIREVWGTRPRI